MGMRPASAEATTVRRSKGRGAEMIAKAHELHGQVSEREKFYIDSYYLDLVVGDLDKA
jgi:hypothetical protein